MSKINIKPLADRVLVQPSEAETTTSSGIIIPDTAKEKPQRGKIVAAGPGTKDNPVTLKAGDIVLRHAFHKRSFGDLYWKQSILL